LPTNGKACTKIKTMRKVFSDSIEKLAVSNEKVIFITGDLGFNAFENLQVLLKDRFINAGVAEQNMIGMAAGLAYKGYKVFCYSIAPFVVYRCLEQMRNDVCFHKLPVFIVGNGGGYGYGIMGSSHHAISDIASLASLPNIKCWVPAFTEDVNVCLTKMIADNGPAYLRLGSDVKKPDNTFVNGNFQRIYKSTESKLTILCLGPLIQNVLNVLAQNNLQDECDLYSVISLPIIEISEEVKQSIEQTKNVLVLEEHVSIGGLGQQIAGIILQKAIQLKSFTSLTAQNYTNELYGNQQYHQVQSSLDETSILSRIKNCL
jgi:transketolase